MFYQDINYEEYSTNSSFPFNEEFFDSLQSNLGQLPQNITSYEYIPEKKVNLNVNAKKQIAPLKINLINKKTYFTTERSNNVGKEKRGRKNKDTEKESKHTKHTDDNMLEKIKNIILGTFLISINSLLKKFYIKELGQNKRLFKLTKKGSRQLDYYKELFNKNLKEIFSDDISKKFKRHNIAHNKILINQLLNEKDENKREIFEKIFNMTFLDCLNCFRNGTFVEEIDFEGLDKYCEKLKSKGEEQLYITKLIYYVKNYEEIIRNKKGRNRKTKTKKKE